MHFLPLQNCMYLLLSSTNGGITLPRLYHHQLGIHCETQQQYASTRSAKATPSSGIERFRSNKWLLWNATGRCTDAPPVLLHSTACKNFSPDETGRSAEYIPSKEITAIGE